MSTTFEPRWASAPGATILDALTAAGLTVEDLADALEYSDADARRLVRGDLPITESVAATLASLVGGSSTFWVRREAQFREDSKWVSADELLSTLPYQQMVEYGWVEHRPDWRGRTSAALDFFAVKDVSEWLERYGRTLEMSQLRASSSFDVNELALAAWLRKAALEADALDVSSWDRSLFLSVLQGSRHLTKSRDPQIFLPQLQSTCASAGVAVVVVRAPRGCPVNGAAMQTSSGVRTIVLSGRHLSDDQLWFTFFHEAAHVLLHETGTPYVDGQDETREADAAETEADSFANSMLRPAGLDELGRHRTTGRPTMREIVALASSEGIAPGILVGQLQHDGRLRFDQLNGLKRRYRWDGPSLRI